MDRERLTRWLKWTGILAVIIVVGIQWYIVRDWLGAETGDTQYGWWFRAGWVSNVLLLYGWAAFWTIRILKTQRQWLKWLSGALIGIALLLFIEAVYSDIAQVYREQQFRRELALEQERRAKEVQEKVAERHRELRERWDRIREERGQDKLPTPATR